MSLSSISAGVSQPSAMGSADAPMIGQG